MTQHSDAGTVADMVAKVRDLLPMIAENALVAEKQRKPVDAVIDKLKQTKSNSEFFDSMNT